MGTTIPCLERGVVNNAQRADHRSDTGFPETRPGQMCRVRTEPPRTGVRQSSSSRSTRRVDPYLSGRDLVAVAIFWEIGDDDRHTLGHAGVPGGAGT
jgi:hypothetical protein